MLVLCAMLGLLVLIVLAGPAEPLPPDDDQDAVDSTIDGTDEERPEDAGASGPEDPSETGPAAGGTPEAGDPDATGPSSVPAPAAPPTQDASVPPSAGEMPEVQRPSAPPPSPPVSLGPKVGETKPATMSESSSSRTAPAAPSGADEETDGGADEKKPERRFKFFRIGLWPKIGYTNGTSQRNGIFDRDKTLQNAMMGGSGVVAGADEDVRYGGFMGGGEIDLEVFLINLTLDFHKFFRPGGMVSVLVGYDHEFWLHRVVRLDIGVGFGFMRIFLGKPLEKLYYDPDNLAATNIGTAGIEGRAVAAVMFRVWGPFYSGVRAMVGYHYLFSANAARASKEHGLHYGVAATFGVEFTLPRDR